MEDIKNVRPATSSDASRLAEILIFAKRSTYRNIFRDDAVSFGELQVLPLALKYQDKPEMLSGVWVYDDGLVKGMLHADLDSGELCELYVDPFFQGQGIGKALMEHAITVAGEAKIEALSLCVLEQNSHARAFYERFGFVRTGTEKFVDGTNVTELRYHLAIKDNGKSGGVLMKKRIVSAFLSLAFLLSLIPGAMAAAPTQMVAMKIGSPWCVVGDQVTQIDEANAEVVPIAESGRTLLPIRRVLEAFGGKVEWLAPNGVTCSLNGVEVALSVDAATATVDGASVALDVPARAKNSRTFVPVRIVSESLGLTVAYDAAHQIVVVADGDLDKDNLAALPQVKTLIEKTTPKVDPTSLKSGSFTLPSGTVSGNVITVNMADPRVSVKAALPDGRVNNTRAFSAIVANSGAAAVINANFFNSYDAIKDPVGHIVADGQFLYASSGGTTLGITADNRMYYGRPSIFISVKTTDGGTPQLWDAYEVNVLKQQANSAIIYTPARGASFPVIYPGAVLTVENGVSTGYRTVGKGEAVSIPANGFVAYFSTEETSTAWFKVPEMGRTMQIVPHLFTADAEGFTLDGVTTVIGGGPRLVKDSIIITELEGGFAYDSRFKGSYAAPRTAIGTTADNKLLLVEVNSATIQQMRELMLQLGCVDAFNLDGGGSTAMYYRGQTLATPGRELTTTLQVFVKD